MDADGIRHLALMVIAIALVCAMMAVFIITIREAVAVAIYAPQNPGANREFIVMAVIGVGATMQTALAPVLTYVINRLMNGGGKAKGIDDGN